MANALHADLIPIAVEVSTAMLVNAVLAQMMRNVPCIPKVIIVIEVNVRLVMKAMAGAVATRRFVIMELAGLAILVITAVEIHSVMKAIA